MSFSQLRRWLLALRRGVCKLVAGMPPVAKAYSVLTLSVLLSEGTLAQCDTFYNTNAANPTRTKNLPRNEHPYFVDIDGDGDLDCYAIIYKQKLLKE